MISYFKRHELDEEKYNNCIKSALNSRIYAYSWYLDCVADNWDVLVMNDYEAVMPLPWRSKYFIKYIYPPAWTQQLGVFSKNIISQNLLKEFITVIPKKFKKITIQFNSGNDVSFLNTTKRINYILPLNRFYDEIYKGFNKNRKRDLTRSEGIAFELDKNVKAFDFFNFFENTSKNFSLNSNGIQALRKICNFRNAQVNIWGIRVNSILYCSLLWLKDDDRITYLLPLATTEAKKNGFPTKLVVELIANHHNSNYILDFEGSMIPNVANFYKSFGVIEEDYHLYSKKSYLMVFKLF